VTKQKSRTVAGKLCDAVVCLNFDVGPTDVCFVWYFYWQLTWPLPRLRA